MVNPTATILPSGWSAMSVMNVLPHAEVGEGLAGVAETSVQIAPRHEARLSAKSIRSFANPSAPPADDDLVIRLHGDGPASNHGLHENRRDG
jgi:hypothetical protein